EAIAHSSEYEIIVNIGAGEGYYAVGLALRAPEAHVVGFEANEDNLALFELLCQNNGVRERITILGLCTIERLNAILTPKALVICDCEGAELELLRPDAIPNLASADILVELHDFIDPSTSPVICERFSATHRVQIVHGQSRNLESNPFLLSKYPFLAGLKHKDRQTFIRDSRPPGMNWAFFRHNSVRTD